MVLFKLSTVFHSVHIILYSHQHYVSDPVSLSSWVGLGVQAPHWFANTSIAERKECLVAHLASTDHREHRWAPSLPLGSEESPAFSLGLLCWCLSRELDGQLILLAALEFNLLEYQAGARGFFTVAWRENLSTFLGLFWHARALGRKLSAVLE